MIKTYVNPEYPYRHSPDQDCVEPAFHPVIIVGAGPCGLAAALDLATQGIVALVLDDNNTVSVGSRAICFSKRTLEIMDRYGCGQRLLDKGITWQTGKVFFQNEQVYEFNLLPESGHHMPAFINLQQYYFEEYMVDRCAELPLIELRWKNTVVAVECDDYGNTLTIDTPEGPYHVRCDYLLVADGANSKIRGMLGLESKGQVFQDRFLIADLVMKADFPTERWFWFDPPFHPNQSVLLHRQADNVWRIDFQLGWDADPEAEKRPENVIPRIRAMLGDTVEFELEWTSVYTFQCRRMDSFIHRRALFIGDAAHQVSPFGARGANGGIQSVDNLAWKLARVLRGEAPPALLRTYDVERSPATDENILHSTRATDFITPKNNVSRIFRDETLRLARDYPFARALINSGRLSLPSRYRDSPLSTADSADFDCAIAPGDPARDAPVTVAGKPDWLLRQLGNRFVCMVNIDVDADRLNTLLARLEPLRGADDVRVLLVSAADTPLAGVVADCEQKIRERYDLRPGTAYLFRPDQIICARWRALDTNAVRAAQRRALGFELEARSCRN